MAELRSSEHLKALAGYARCTLSVPFRLSPQLIPLTSDAVPVRCSAAINKHAPMLSQFCNSMLEKIEEYDPALKRPFKGCPFSTMTLNLGPRVRTVPHKDFKNLPFGLCSVTSLGRYDPKKGGRVILWDLKIAVEFPSHSTILIPSAFVEHSNTGIAEGESRMSVTFYNSAGLFRWLAYECMPKWQAEEKGIAPASWWSSPTHWFSKLPPEDCKRLNEVVTQPFLTAAALLTASTLALPAAPRHQRPTARTPTPQAHPRATPAPQPDAQLPTRQAMNRAIIPRRLFFHLTNSLY